MAKKTRVYAVIAPVVPGQLPTLVGHGTGLPEARKLAAQFDNRKDLCYQDVAIRRQDGVLAEYAGPCR